MISGEIFSILYLDKMPPGPNYRVEMTDLMGSLRASRTCIVCCG